MGGRRASDVPATLRELRARCSAGPGSASWLTDTRAREVSLISTDVRAKARVGWRISAQLARVDHASGRLAATRATARVRASHAAPLRALGVCRLARGPRAGGMRLATCDVMPARSIDTATLAFGLVSIPVKIYSTGEPSHELHFHLVHEDCGERLRQQYVCPEHGKVERDEIIKGFELTKGNFVQLTKQELKALEAVASDEIAIEEFVPADAVDPVLIDRSYYLGPGKGGDRAYQLFRDAIEHAELVAIARYAARGKQYIVELRPFETGLMMHQLRYPDEVKAWSEIPVPKHTKAAAAELALAGQFIESLRHETFDPSQYKDEVKARVRSLIASKAKGGEITAPPAVERPPVTDLMAALKASLGAEPGARRNGRSAQSNGRSARSSGRSARSNGRSARSSGSSVRSKGRSARASESSKPAARSTRTTRSTRSTTRSSRSHAGGRRASGATRSTHASHRSTRRAAPRARV
jgi:DNA end-binding protein Ku